MRVLLLGAAGFIGANLTKALGARRALGLRGAAPQPLAELVLAALRTGADPGSPGLLAEYQRRRRPANLVMLGATDALDRLFSTDNPLVRRARDLGIAGVHRMPRLKRLFVRQAMGS